MTNIQSWNQHDHTQKAEMSTLQIRMMIQKNILISEKWDYTYQIMIAEGIASLIKSRTSSKASFEKPVHVFLQAGENLT